MGRAADGTGLARSVSASEGTTTAVLRRRHGGNSMYVRVDVVSPASRPAAAVYSRRRRRRRRGGQTVSSTALAGRRRSITTCRSGEPKAGVPLPVVDHTHASSLSPSPRLTDRIPVDHRPPARRSPLFVRRRAECGTSGLHSLRRSLIQSRLDFSHASFHVGSGEPAYTGRPLRHCSSRDRRIMRTVRYVVFGLSTDFSAAAAETMRADSAFDSTNTLTTRRSSSITSYEGTRPPPLTLCHVDR